jgi:hypothetical protein
MLPHASRLKMKTCSPPEIKAGNTEREIFRGLAIMVFDEASQTPDPPSGEEAGSRNRGHFTMGG